MHDGKQDPIATMCAVSFGDGGSSREKVVVLLGVCSVVNAACMCD